jgi:hypothetical protein
MKKITFKEYYQSKEALLLAAEDAPLVVKLYEVNKYCKLPVYGHELNGEKEYVSFKPKDSIEVLWEYSNPEVPILKSLKIINTSENVCPSWSNCKFLKWIESSCFIKN